MSNPILIWGAGAIGGTIGAYLARAGETVHFVDLVEEHVRAISGDGLRIDGPVDQFAVTCPAFLPAELSGRTYDRVFLAVKSQHTEAALNLIKPHLAADGYVLSCQNGLNEPPIAEEIGPERTIGAFVNFGADWQGPGHITFGNRGAVVIGELDGASTARVKDLHRILREFEPDAVLTDNIYGFLWSKLAWGTVLKAEAVTQDTISDFLSREELRPLLRQMIRSVLDVAVAEGVRPMPFQFFDPQAFLASDAAADACLDAIRNGRSNNGKLYSGVWRDIMVRRRPTEVPWQLGPVVEIGRRHGMPMTTIQGLIDAIRKVEAGASVTGIEHALALAEIARQESGRVDQHSARPSP